MTQRSARGGMLIRGAYRVINKLECIPESFNSSFLKNFQFVATTDRFDRSALGMTGPIRSERVDPAIGCSTYVIARGVFWHKASRHGGFIRSERVDPAIVCSTYVIARGEVLA
jgi:hypothetical protein